MKAIRIRAASAVLMGLLLSSAALAGQDALAVERYEDRELGAVLERLPDSAFASMGPADRLLHLRAEARAGRGYAALEQLGPLLDARPDDVDVLATAAVVHHAAGDRAAAGRFVRTALRRDPDHVEALRVDIVLRIHRHDTAGALASYELLRRAHPELNGRAWDVLYAQSLAEALGDGGVRARALEDVAGRLEERAEAAASATTPPDAGGGDPEEVGVWRERAAFFLRIAGRPQFLARADGDRVSLPFTRCWDGTPYRCVVLRADGVDYQVLLDSGNEYGFGVHAPALVERLTTDRGGGTVVTTGSVDSAFVAHDFFADSVGIGPLTLLNVPAVASPKVREPWFDANLNPFFLRDRVITLDYVNDRVLVRTKARFDADLAAAPESAWVRVPVLDNDRPYVEVTINGAPATAVIETGAEVLGLTTGFGRRAGLELTPDSMEWRGRTLRFHTAAIHVDIDGHAFFRDTVRVWPGRVNDRDSGLIYDAIIGPGSLEGRYALSFDPVDQVVVLERGGAREAGTPDP